MAWSIQLALSFAVRSFSFAVSDGTFLAVSFQGLTLFHAIIYATSQALGEFA